MMTPVNDPSKRQWLHTSILDEAAFSESTRTLSNGKTPGPDGIINEIIKIAPTELKRCLHTLFILMWATGITPQGWKESLTCLLYKDKGRRTDINKYRPVGLQVYKLYTRMVSNALFDYAETHQILSSTQKGFRKRASCMDQVQMVTMAVTDYLHPVSSSSYQGHPVPSR
jgi:hypothetical protein